MINTSRYSLDLHVRHRQATLVTMLRHGTLDDPDLTPDRLAELIGLPTERLTAYLKDSYPRWVDSLVARFLSVPVRHWQPKGEVHEAAVS